MVKVQTELNVQTNEITRQLGEVNSDFITVNTKQAFGALSGSCIMFYLPDKGEPIQLRNIATVTLGRVDNKYHPGPLPNIDLSDHHAKLLGVSRIHAEIFNRDGEYYVRDLESTNGTWVNGIKLAPYEAYKLSNGTSLRLGHLMIQIGAC